LRQEMEKDRHRPAFARERIECSAFSPDNTMMAVGGSRDGRVLLLHKTDKGIERQPLNDDAPVEQARKGGFTVSVDQLTFAPDGRTLAAAYSDGRMILWNPRTGRPRHILSFPRHGECYRCLEFSPDGRLLALSDRHALYLVESASGRQFRERLLGR